MNAINNNPITDIRHKFHEIQVSPEWCFKNVRSTEQWTHGYHRYPAKFLPNLVKKLIENYTVEDDLVADLFAGCGTTLVEAKVHGRKSFGVDINPVAILITNAKTSPIKPEVLYAKYSQLLSILSENIECKITDHKLHEKLDYWYFPEDKLKIANLYYIILKEPDESIKNFFLVALSNILKNCSKWLQSSTKPQIDQNKTPADPIKAFKSQVNQMIKRNNQFFDHLTYNGFINVPSEIKLEDARKTSLNANSVSAIITSPPYVTSYEYADIHQLTAYWYEYINDLYGFRKGFIGTFYSLNQELNTHSFTGQEVVNNLIEKDKRTAKEVANYFNNMYDVGKEMYRILKPEGHVCVVIGNTTLMNVKIKSSEVFAEILQLQGFKIVDIIKRSIPNKLIPTIRDNITGRFSNYDNKNSKLVYPEEYILIAKK
ncbi:DNA methylase [Bacteroidales bacterium 6E]|nr:DNA methylase [Bacteroidales bacterium 6E]